MVIAKSPVLVKGNDRLRVVIQYNLKPGEFRIATSSLHREGDHSWEESGSGLYTKDERRAQYLFLENWELLKDVGFVIDQDYLAEENNG